MRPPVWLTTIWPNSCGVCRRPRRRMVRSSMSPCRRPDRHRQVLRLQRRDHLADAHAGRLHRDRVDLDGDLALDRPDHDDLRDVADAAQRVGHARVGDLRQLGARQVGRRQRQRDDREVVRIEALEDRLLDLRRQFVADLGDLVANLLHRLGRLLAELELGDDQAEAVERLRVELLEPADARDPLLDRVDDVALDLVGRRAGERQRHRRSRAARSRGTRRLRAGTARRCRTPRAPASRRR